MLTYQNFQVLKYWCLIFFVVKQCICLCISMNLGLLSFVSVLFTVVLDSLFLTAACLFQISVVVLLEDFAFFHCCLFCSGIFYGLCCFYCGINLFCLFPFVEQQNKFGSYSFGKTSSWVMCCWTWVDLYLS